MTDQHGPRALGDPGSSPLGDQVLQSQTLESVATAAVEYHEWLTFLARPYLGTNPIELGSGFGDYAQAWLDSGVRHMTVSDIEPSRQAHLRRRFAGDDRADVCAFDVLAPPTGDYSSLVAYNVLEHIPDHVRALRSAHSLVKPGGAVIMFVPAFEFAMSRFDRQVGHLRRYTVSSLTAAFAEAGLEPEHVHYVNMPGLVAWFIGMRVMRMTPSGGRLLRLWDSQVVPRARRWEDRNRARFGQSVFGVARVPTR